MMYLLLVLVLLLAGVDSSNSHQMGPHRAPDDPAPRSQRNLGPCFPSPCFHQGVCQVVDDNPSCTCKPGFRGPFCKEMVLRMECEEEYMTMMVRKEVFNMLKIPLALVHLKNHDCKVSEQAADGETFWGAKLTGENHTTCGSVIKVNGSHVSYTNVIESDREDQGGVITRAILVHVNFSCIYAYKRVVGLLYPLKAMDTLVQFAVKEGDFTVTMALYESATYERAYRHQPLVLLMSDTLFVLLQIEGQDQVKYFFLSVEDCWGTPTADPYHSTKHPLIVKGCPQDKTLTFLNAIGTSTVAKFSFQMFQFKNFTEVFLHCQVRLCIPDNQEPCAKQCPNNKKRKRELDSYRKIVSYGPIQLQGPSRLEAKNTNPSDDQQSFGGLQLWIAIVVCFVAVSTAFILTAVVKAMKK
ncbi:uromodulin-like [Tiliqua scincoides]|uniref:uromodulin-like n=1 Tax=Tiliqua scincoides TaxID=71010 RepID=UPI0034636542